MPLPRKKSCAQCRTAKARCSVTLPECRRCYSRGLRCVYGAAFLTNITVDSSPITTSHSRIGKRPLVPRHHTASESRSFSLEHITISAGAGSIEVGNSSRELSLLREGSKEPQEIDLPRPASPVRVWTSTSSVTPSRSDIDSPSSLFPDKSTLPTSRRTYPLSFLHVPPPDDVLLCDDDPSGNGVESALRRTSARVYLPSLCSSTFPLLLSLKKIPDIKTALIAKHLQGIITAYPSSLAERNRLPPFLHPLMGSVGNSRELVRTKEDISLPEPMANCVNMIHMYQHKTAASTPFVWRTIITEQQRLFKEFGNFDRERKLSTLQAMVIYMLLEATQEVRDETYSVMLVVAMGEMSTKIHGLGYLSPAEQRGTIPDWGDWIFRESLRRTITFLYFLDLLVDLNVTCIPHQNCTGIDEAPLPCSKALWNARSYDEWCSTYMAYLDKKESRAMLKYGHLRDPSTFKENGANNKIIQELNRWAEDADEFGSMLLLAATGMRDLTNKGP